MIGIGIGNGIVIGIGMGLGLELRLELELEPELEFWNINVQRRVVAQQGTLHASHKTQGAAIRRGNHVMFAESACPALPCPSPPSPAISLARSPLSSNNQHHHPPPPPQQQSPPPPRHHRAPFAHLSLARSVGSATTKSVLLSLRALQQEKREKKKKKPNKKEDACNGDDRCIHPNPTLLILSDTAGRIIGAWAPSVLSALASTTAFRFVAPSVAPSAPPPSPKKSPDHVPVAVFVCVCVCVFVFLFLFFFLLLLGGISSSLSLFFPPPLSFRILDIHSKSPSPPIAAHYPLPPAVPPPPTSDPSA